MEESMLKFARCMREHGVDVPDPKPGEGIRIGGPGSELDPEDPSFQKAQKACEGDRPRTDRATAAATATARTATSEPATHRPHRRRRRPRHRPGRGGRLDRLRRRARRRRHERRPVGAAVGPGLRRTAPASSGDGSTPQSTAEVERRDLITREESDGTLGYTDERARRQSRPGHADVDGRGGLARPARRRSSTASTPGPCSGSRAASRPGARWRTGSTTAWTSASWSRTSSRSGFDPDKEIDVDTEFDDATEDAIERWQEKTHQEETGRVELGTVVFLPGQTRRIAEVQGTVGGRRRRRHPLHDLDAPRGDVRDRRPRRRPGAGGQVRAGRAARRHDRAAARSPASAAWPRAAATTRPPRTTPTIEVTVRLEAGKGIDAFDQAPVLVRVETEAERDALAVPVGALLALAGGGYALELADCAPRWCRSRSARSPTATCR